MGTGIRINRITVLVDMEEDDAIINMYRTNTLLGSVHYELLDLISPQDSGLTSKSYGEYAKDVAINLINNGGVDGYYYEEKQSVEGIKFDNSEFKKQSKEYIAKVLDGMEFKMDTDVPCTSERYKNNFIKDAQADFVITLGGTSFAVRCEVRSGQMCRPRVMLYKEQELVFNITNVKRIIKDPNCI